MKESTAWAFVGAIANFVRAFFRVSRDTFFDTLKVVSNPIPVLICMVGGGIAATTMLWGSGVGLMATTAYAAGMFGLAFSVAFATIGTIAFAYKTVTGIIGWWRERQIAKSVAAEIAAAAAR